MKKLTIITLLLFCFILVGCSSQNNTSINSSTTEETNHSDSINSISSQTEKLSDLSSLYPISDVLDGEGLEGTWINRANADNIDSTMVLALNSDQSFNFFVEIVTPDSSGTAKGNGNYSVDGDILKLNFESNPDNTNEPQIIDDSEYVFVLDKNTLVLTDNDNQLIEYHRVVNE